MTTSRPFVRKAIQCGLCSLFLLISGQTFGQGHPLFHTRMPTGEIARRQLARRPQLLGVFQPVMLKVPKDAIISVAEGPDFATGDLGSMLVSLQVGETYRLRVSNIPHESGEVYPTVELLDRMHAPAGKETRYPIPIDLTQAELGMALNGKFVTRVIYVEDPRNAVPVRDLPEQRYLEVMAHEDPLQVADTLGRPVAILRMGTLTPSSMGPSDEFLFGSPPFLRHSEFPVPAPYVPSPLRLEEGPPSPLTPNLPQIIEHQTPKQRQAETNDGPLEVLNPFQIQEPQEDAASEEAIPGDLGDPFELDESNAVDDVDLDAESPFDEFE